MKAGWGEGGQEKETSRGSQERRMGGKIQQKTKHYSRITKRGGEKLFEGSVSGGRGEESEESKNKGRAIASWEKQVNWRSESTGTGGTNIKED